MKLKNIKKVNVLVASIILLSLVLCLTGCSKEEQKIDDKENSKYKIGITQIVNHKSLNKVREGFEKRINELGLDAEIDYQNAQGDISTSQLIAEKFVSDKKDLVIAISTPSAQSVHNAGKNSDVKIIFTAVSDPISADLAAENGNVGNITGVTDRISEENINELLNISLKLKNDKKSVGIIYNIGETNSLYQVNEIKKVAEKMNVAIEEVGIANISDIDQAIEVISEKSDSLFLIADNMIASTINLIAEKAKEKNLITISAVDSFVEEGALISIGVDYESQGVQAAEIAKKILVDKINITEIPVQEPTKLYKTLNAKTAGILGVDIDNLSKDVDKTIE